MSKNNIYLIRHGEAEHNIKESGGIDGEKYFIGQAGRSKLTDRGLIQAFAAAKHLHDSNIKIFSIISSPQERALITAKAIECYHDCVATTTDKNLMERNFGVLENSSHTAVKKNYQAVYNYLEVEKDYLLDAIPSGDSTLSLARRGLKAVYSGFENSQKINLTEQSNAGIALVSHSWLHTATVGTLQYLHRNNLSLDYGIKLLDNNLTDKGSLEPEIKFEAMSLGKSKTKRLMNTDAMSENLKHLQGIASTIESSPYCPNTGITHIGLNELGKIETLTIAQNEHLNEKNLKNVEKNLGMTYSNSRNADNHFLSIHDYRNKLYTSAQSQLGVGINNTILSKEKFKTLGFLLRNNGHSKIEKTTVRKGFEI